MLPVVTFLYAAAYYLTRPIFDALLASKASVIEPYNNYISYALLLGILLVGMLQDYSGPRAAITVTNLASVFIYAILSGFAFSKELGLTSIDVIPVQVFIVLKGLTVLQHTMQAAMAAANSGMSSATAKVRKTCLVSAGYGLGYVAGTLALKQLNPQQATGAALACSVLALLVGFGVKSDFPSKAVFKAPSLVTLVLTNLHLFIAVFLIRLGRMWLVGSTKNITGVTDPFKPFGLGIDYSIGVPVNLVLIPFFLLPLFRTAKYILLIAIAAAFLVATSQLTPPPPELQDFLTPQFLFFAGKVLAAILYNMSASFVCYSVQPHGAGRAYAILCVFTYALMFSGGAEAITAAFTPSLANFLADWEVPAALAPILIQVSALPFAFSATVMVFRPAWDVAGKPAADVKKNAELAAKKRR